MRVLNESRYFYHSGSETLFENIVDEVDGPCVDRELRRFPDDESYVRIDSDVEGDDVVVFCSLDRPDPKFLSLVYTADVLREENAKSVVLLAPYLAYMRQDKQFQPGEAVTSRTFAGLVNSFFDGLITMDPHLHRYESLDELYEIPSAVLHADPVLADWVEANVEKPYLIGPDEESEQWVREVAERIEMPYNVLTKVRHGDQNVEVTFDDPDDRTDRTPVLIDDIISTAGTMIKATRTMLRNNYPAPVCVGVHAIFADDAYEDLQDAGAERIATANTVDHLSNEIDLSSIIIDGLQK